MPAEPTRPGTWSDPARAHRVALGALVLLTLVVFARGLLGEFVWDDHKLVRVDAAGGGLGHALTTPFFEPEAGDDGGGYYRPVVKLAYMAQRAVYGDEPSGFHVVNLGLHLSCVLLVFGWLRRRLGEAGDVRVVVAAAVGAAIFAVHPTRPESVSWVSGSTDLWLTLFVMLGLLAWDRRPGREGVAWAAAGFCAALLCKESAIVLPALLAVDAVLLRRRPLGDVGWVALAMGAVVAMRLALVPAPRRSLDAIGDDPIRRVVASFGYYAEATFAPLWPTAMPGSSLAPGEFPGWSLAAGSLVLLVSASLLAVAVSRPRARPWLADASWLVVALLPVVNIIPLGLRYLVAWRYLYLPLLGLSALAARAMARGLERPDAARACSAVAGALILGMALASYQHAAHFASDEALWQWEHQVDPHNVLAAEILAFVRLERGDREGAAHLMNTGARAAERVGDARQATRFRLLLVSLRLEDTADANGARLAAIRTFYDELLARGRAELTLGEERIAVTSSLGAGRPPDAARYFAIPRALAHARTGRLDAAAAQLGAALEAEPGSWEAGIALARVLALAGRWSEATAAAERATSLPRVHAAAVEMAGKIGRARQAVEAPASDPIAAELAHAQAAMLLELPGAARRRLDRLDAALRADPRIVRARVGVEIVDGCLREAREIAGDDEALRAEVEAAAGTARPRVCPPR